MMFLFNYYIFSIFPVFFTFFFVSRVFLYFSLSKAASCYRYTHCYSSKLEFLSNLGSENNPHYYGAYQLVNCLICLILQPIFCIIHPLREVFDPCNHGVHGVIRLWSF